MAYDEARDLIDERDREAVDCAIKAAIRSPDRGAWSSVHRVLRADGTIRWVSQRGLLTYRDAAGGPLAVRSIGTIIDITHLKEAEAALAESERRLRLALDAARMGTFEADMEASDARIDEQEARLLGLPEGTRRISTEEMRKRIPIEDLEASDGKQHRLTKHREPYHHEFRLHMSDGSERWLSAYADVRGNRIFGVNFDVSARKAAEAALRASEARLRVAASGAALGVFEWEVETDHAVWENDRMYEIFGADRRDHPIGKQEFIRSYLHPADAPAFERALEEALRNRGGSFQTMCRIKRKGAIRWLLVAGIHETWLDRPHRIVGVVADITVHKRLEAKSNALSDRLTTTQEEERRNIALELHDSTVQHLVAANLNLMSVKAESLSEKDQKHWLDIEGSLREAMRELRTFTYLLVPPTLALKGLRHSLREYVLGFASRSGLDVRFSSSACTEKIPLRSQRVIFRITQEALANIYRHAFATEVSVELRRKGPQLHLIIVDNGLSRSRAGERRRRFRAGVGIRGMKMRLDQVGGRLRISQRRAGGTKVHAVLPAGDPTVVV
jgi:signal transduction histidine kinase